MLSLPSPDNLAFEHRRTRLISRIMAMVIAPVALVFFFDNYHDGNLIAGGICLGLVLCSAALWLTGRPALETSRSYVLMQWLLVLSICLISVLMVLSGLNNHYYGRFFWAYPLSIIVFLALGIRVGLAWLAVFFLIVGATFAAALSQAAQVAITPGDVWRFLASLLATGVAGFVLERELRKDQRNLQKKQAALQRSETLYREACLSLLRQSRRRGEDNNFGLMEQLSQSQKNETLGLLAGGVAHDFNNLLGSMLSFTSMAINELPAAHEARKHLILAEKAGGQAKELVRRLLDFSRRDDPVKEPLFLDDLLAEALELVRPMLAPGVRLLVEKAGSEDGRPVVMGNAPQLQQMIFNLCLNASQAMALTGGKIHVELAKDDLSAGRARDLALRPGEFARLTVRDTGPGLPSQDLDKIFEPFYTTKPKGEGTGMGLFVVRGIVEACGGGISARSRPGRGAVFTVYLPLAQERPSSSEVVEMAMPEMPRGQGQRVLYVDDDESLGNTMRMVLEELGYQAKVSRSGEEAWALLRQEPGGVDLVISDLCMGGLNGDELAARCRGLKPDMPVIIATGRADSRQVKALKSKGVATILAKPVSARRLAVAIRETLDLAGSAGKTANQAV